MKYHEALRLAAANKLARIFPSASDPRTRGRVLFPAVRPSFRLPFSRQTKVFTIGSCFARNIEEALERLDVALPTKAFSAPPSEAPGRPNGMLNEYNPATIANRITAALSGARDPLETLVERGDGFLDLLLPPGHPNGSQVGMERCLQRRAQIAEVYTHLASSDLVVITLGFIEAWFDNRTQMYLNQMPPSPAANREPERFVFRRIELEESLRLLTGPLTRLTQAGAKVLLTVSPVPIQVTFTNGDCVVANQYSKSVLRACAELLCRSIPNVDYYPSYEIVVSGGLASYVDDQVHVRDELVREITRYMVECYSQPA